MKKFALLLLAYSLTAIQSFAQWKPVEGRIHSSWSSKVSPTNVLPEYPRPLMERTEWKNLNGLWQYAIINKGNQLPSQFEGEILVPFAIQSSLSGVGKMMNEKQELVYKRTFTVPSSWQKQNVLLHFGAVDWKADVWVNDIKVGSHTGGYTPFSFNITQALDRKGENTLVVKVWDPTDKGKQPRGKQVSKPIGIFYTQVSGIWQTVWLEPVAPSHINNLRITLYIDNSTLSLDVKTSGHTSMQRVDVEVFDGKQSIAHGASINGEKVELNMPKDMKLWSPSSPFIYDIKVTLRSNGKVVDQVKSYTAMRKYSIKRDQHGIVRMQLNNKDLFQYGPLDQGWWPDGLYTAPTDEALAFDIQKTKDWGFNMIRKHVKVEPARWYMHCDRLGMIVWQDMPSGDGGQQWQNRDFFKGPEKDRTPESEACYRKEWKEIMDYLYSYPCIGSWIPFNEAWGQFKTVEIAQWTKAYDPTRLVNPASGGNFFNCGDILDLHNYPAPQLYLYDAQRATVLGEYGGIGLVIPNHVWENKEGWGYIKLKSSKEATDVYVDYANKLYELIEKGFSAAVYTQTTDVETEVNGLMTYDREVMKMEENRIKEINQKICHSLDN